MSVSSVSVASADHPAVPLESSAPQTMTYRMAPASDMEGKGPEPLAPAAVAAPAPAPVVLPPLVMAAAPTVVSVDPAVATPVVINPPLPIEASPPLPAPEIIHPPATPGHSDSLPLPISATPSAAIVAASAPMNGTEAMDPETDDARDDETDYGELEQSSHREMAAAIQADQQMRRLNEAALVERKQTLMHFRDAFQSDMMQMVNQFEHALTKVAALPRIEEPEAVAISRPPQTVDDRETNYELENGFLMNPPNATSFGFVKSGSWKIKSLKWDQGSDSISVLQRAEFDMDFTADYPWKLIIRYESQAVPGYVRHQCLKPTMDLSTKQSHFSSLMHFEVHPGQIYTFECADPTKAVLSAKASLLLYRRPRYSALPPPSEAASTVTPNKPVSPAMPVVSARSPSSSAAGPTPVAVPTVAAPNVVAEAPVAVETKISPAVQQHANKTVVGPAAGGPRVPIHRPPAVGSPGTIPASVLPATWGAITDSKDSKTPATAATPITATIPSPARPLVTARPPSAPSSGVVIRKTPTVTNGTASTAAGNRPTAPVIATVRANPAASSTGTASVSRPGPAAVSPSFAGAAAVTVANGDRKGPIISRAGGGPPPAVIGGATTLQSPSIPTVVATRPNARPPGPNVVIKSGTTGVHLGGRMGGTPLASAAQGR